MHTKTTALMLVPILFASCVVDADTQSASSPLGSSSNVPDLQSPEPIIYLADNLDEQDRLGYCIDTDGKGFSDSLQVHSCKPNGDDVLFYYDAETEQICSATYPGYCAAMIGGPQIGMTIGLVESAPGSSEQSFIYDEGTGEFWPTEDATLCLAAGSSSDDAGPYMSRTLSLQPRESTAQELKTWVIKGER